MMRNPSPTMKSKSSTTTTPCCSKIGIKRGPWTAEEDEVLANYINKEGEGRWRTLPKRAGLLRCGKSCRLRWMNYLRPSVKRGRIAPDEEDLILRLHRLLGNRWSLIAGRIPGRTDNEIKNYWNTHLSKKLISQGIDPRTHKPLINFNPNFNSITLNTLHDLPNNNTSSFQIKDTGTVNTKASENLTRTSTDQNQGQVANDGTGRNLSNGYNDQLIGTQQGFMRNEDITNMELNKGGCSGNDQDPFSSFLDSLIGDNVLNGNPRGMHTTATRADIIQPGGNDNLQTQLQRAFEGNPCFLDGNPIAQQQQQQQQQNYVSSTQPIPLFMSSASSLNHSTTWETEMLASVAFGDHHNNNNYHLNGESVFYNNPN